MRRETIQPYGNPFLNAQRKCSVRSPARRSSLIGPLVLLILTGCGSGTDVGVDKACTDLAESECAKRQSCTDSIDLAGFSIERNFGDMATCLAREKLACVTNLASPGTGNNPAQIEKCVDAFPTYACADFFGANPPDACAPVGSRTMGQPCSFNSQCQGRFCSNDKTATCGTCAPSPAAGDPCTLSNCGHHQTCVASTLLCQDRGDLDAFCDATHPCGFDLSCVVLPGDPTGTCQVARVNEGDPCLGATQPGCHGNFGISCRGPAAGRVCTRIALVDDGQACGTLADGSRADCRRGECFTATGLATTAELGTCKANVDTGGACDTNLGPSCFVPDRCVPNGASTTAGTCQTPTAGSCG